VLQVVPAVCGNGSVEGTEDCDDGGTVGGDCCSATCAFEAFGSPCNDGDACTEVDSCDGSGLCEPGAPLACDDGVFCNGEETCDPGSGCLAGTPPVTDDGVGCTVDACDEGADAVLHTPDDSLCDDGLYCNGSETCDAVADCQPGDPPTTDDGVSCTADSCDEANDSIVHTPDDLLCDDADVCTVDICDAIADCGYEPIPLCGAGVSATPPRGPAILGLLVLASGAALLSRRRRGGPKGASGSAAPEK
jgi:cysteine-rich repeat protein